MADIQKPDSPNQAGPNFPPPPLPTGWIAQWDPNSKRYYYVQPSTATTTWDVPVHSASSTPAQQIPAYSPPAVGAGYDPAGPYNAYSQQQMHSQEQHAPEQTSRAGGFGGIAGNLAQGLLSGGGKPNKHGSSSSGGGLGSLASGLLGGGKPNKHSSSGSSGGGLLGTATSLLGGGKPGKNSSSSSGGGAGTLMNLANNFLSGHSSGGASGSVSSNSRPHTFFSLGTD